MKRSARLLLVVLMACLAACTTSRGVIPAQCNAMCFQACTGKDGDTGVRWEAGETDPSAWDALGSEVTGQLADKLRTCDKRREACTQCLQRLNDQGVIKL